MILHQNNFIQIAFNNLHIFQKNETFFQLEGLLNRRY